MPRSAAQQRFVEAVRRPDEQIDLARSALLFAASEYPELDVDGYLGRFGQLADEAVQAVPADYSGPDRFRSLAEQLFGEHGFRGNRDDYYDARNSYLNDVLDRRLGLPISLSVVFLEVARRLNLPVYGVGLPAHFMVKYQDGAEELFVDPFNGGEILDEAGCVQRVSEVMGRKVLPSPSSFARTGARQMLRRMLNNLRGVHLQHKDLEQSIRTVEHILILEPDSSGDLRDLGVLYHHAGRQRESVVCFERYLELAPDAGDAEQVERNLEFLRRHLSEQKGGEATP